MSTKNSRNEWDRLSQRQKEDLWKKKYGTGIIPQNISNHEISNILKYEETNYNQRKERDDDSGFGKDIRGSI